MMDVVLHVADPPFTAKLRAKPQRPLAAVAAAFCKAFQKKHGVALERYELRVDGAALPADALVEALAGRAAELVPSSSTATPSSSAARPPTSSGAPLAPRPPGSSRVVAFLASHVGQASRLESLDACLESVERQRSAPARLVVAVSAAAAVRRAARAVLDRRAARLRAAGVRVDVEYGDAQSQFRHYKARSTRDNDEHRRVR